MNAAASVRPAELVVFEIHYADRVGENYFAKHDENHRWFFYPALTRDEALQKISQPAYDEETIAHDFEYVATKLDIGVDELRTYLDGPNRTYRDYRHSMGVINLGTQVLRLLGVQRAIIR